MELKFGKYAWTKTTAEVLDSISEESFCTSGEGCAYIDVTDYIESGIEVTDDLNEAVETCEENNIGILQLVIGY